MERDPEVVEHAERRQRETAEEDLRLRVAFSRATDDDRDHTDQSEEQTRAARGEDHRADGLEGLVRHDERERGDDGHHGVEPPEPRREAAPTRAEDDVHEERDPEARDHRRDPPQTKPERAARNEEGVRSSLEERPRAHAEAEERDARERVPLAASGGERGGDERGEEEHDREDEARDVARDERTEERRTLTDSRRRGEPDLCVPGGHAEEHGDRRTIEGERDHVEGHSARGAVVGERVDTHAVDVGGEGHVRLRDDDHRIARVARTRGPRDPHLVDAGVSGGTNESRVVGGCERDLGRALGDVEALDSANLGERELFEGHARPGDAREGAHDHQRDERW